MRHWRATGRWFLMLAALAVAGLGAAEAWRRHGLYWYDVRKDYSYAFDPSLAGWTPVRVSADGFNLPAAARAGGTALLELQVTATLFGWWFEPCLEITYADQRDVQCFERGARGRRYALLPMAAADPGAKVQLRGHHLRWQPQEARFAVFPAPALSGRRLLVLAPHPDDGEIAAFGLYSATDAYVATMTAGNYVDGLYGGLGLDAQAQDRLRGELRVWDSLVVPQLGGVPPARTVNLGYLTYTLKDFHDAAVAATASAQGAPLGSYREGAVPTLLAGRPGTADWASLVADLEALVKATSPDIVVTPHPALDDHTDHQYTTIALLEALEALGDRHATLLLYNNHHRLSEHYPFGPATALVTLPPWFENTRVPAVLSYGMDDETQLRKLFALEAMHDLRMPPLRLDTGAPFEVLLLRLGQAFELVRRDPFGDYSYFRRAVRPNELFFVYPPESRPTVEEAVAWLRR